MRQFYLIIIVLTTSICSTVNAQKTLDKSKDTLTTWQTFKYDTNASWKGIKHAVTRPLHWKGKDYAPFGGMVLGNHYHFRNR